MTNLRRLMVAAMAQAIIATTSVAQTVTQTLYFDFGESNNASRGMLTEGADANGHYWNNICSSGGIYIYPGKTFTLVNSDNQATGYNLLVNVRFTTNGKSGGGGLLSPSRTLLGDLAIASATEDYCFIESATSIIQHHGFMTFQGLDPQKAYRFYAFGSRNTTEERAGWWEFRGENVWEDYMQISGPAIGANNYNGNNNTILVSDPVFPDRDGCIRMTMKKFRPDRMLMLNAMKIEEVDGLERPNQSYKLKQTIYLDAGENNNSRGHQTQGADKNGNYWNNMVSDPSGSDYIIPVGRSINLVNAANNSTGYKAEMVTVMYTNGGSAAGGMTNPTDANLGDLAIASATEDYVWIAVDGKRQMRFTGLNKSNAYKFYIYGSRDINEPRHSVYTLNAQTDWSTIFQTSGVDIGGQGVQANVRNIAVSDYLFPDSNGNILFTLERYNSQGYGHFNLIKIEEYEGATRPDDPVVFSNIYVTGTASEDGADVELKQLSPSGTPNGIYETYLRLQPGTYLLKGVTTAGDEIMMGSGGSQTSVEVGGDAFNNESEQVVRLRYDSKKGQLTVTPLTLYVKGNICRANTVVDYAGNGVWKSEVAMDDGSVYLFSDKYFYFAFNNSDMLAVKRLSGSRTKVAMPSEGFAGDNIRLNQGTYTVSLDMRNYTFDLEAPIDEYKISLFGSSVANGTGATDNHGYGYMYNTQLSERYSRKLSTNNFYISGVSIGGNTTIDLTNRYDEMIHDFGRYVIFGLSLGNEGIHGAANPQAIFNQWRDNMLKLIERAKADGKIPVVMNNYTRGDFNSTDYDYVKQLNVLIHQWDVPSVNTLGAIDDGSGHWATNYQNGDDVYHPNTLGHREFMYAIPPSLFDAIALGKPKPERNTSTSMTLANGEVVAFKGEPTVHPFTVNVRIQGNDVGRLFTMTHPTRKAECYVDVNEDGYVVFHPFSGDNVVGRKKLSAEGWHSVTLTHYYAQKRTVLYVDNIGGIEVAGNMLIDSVKVGDHTSSVARRFSEVWFWRAGMNSSEIASLNNGRMLQSSLEIYAPLSDDNKDDIANLAQTTNTLKLLEPDPSAISVADYGTMADITAEGQKGAIVVSADKPAMIKAYSADGRLVFSESIEGEQTIEGLPSGIYVVNDKKVVVK